MLAGGLWLISTFEGEFGGAKFEGRGQFGYDASKGKYVGTWIDSMSPNMSLLEGFVRRQDQDDDLHGRGGRSRRQDQVHPEDGHDDEGRRQPRLHACT